MRGSPVCSGPNQRKSFRETFYTQFSMHKSSEFLSWVADPSTEVSNGSMLLVYLVKLELLPRIGLKTPSLTPGVPNLLGFRVVLSGGVQNLRVFLSTIALLHAEPITITFDVIVFIGDKIFIESSTRKLYWTFVTRSCPMTQMTDRSKSCLTDNLRTISIM